MCFDGHDDKDNEADDNDDDDDDADDNNDNDRQDFGECYANTIMADYFYFEQSQVFNQWNFEIQSGLIVNEFFVGQGSIA